MHPYYQEVFWNGLEDANCQPLQRLTLVAEYQFLYDEVKEARISDIEYHHNECSIENTMKLAAFLFYTFSAKTYLHSRKELAKAMVLTISVRSIARY